MNLTSDFRYFLVLGVSLFLIAFIALNTIASEQVVEKTTASNPNDLSETNWDEGEEKETGVDTDEGGWQEEDTAEQTTVEKDTAARHLIDLKKTKAREKTTHISGFFFFIFYIMGGLLTAYFTRNRKIAVHFPPELLILLHSVWPLEILLLPLFGRKIR